MENVRTKVKKDVILLSLDTSTKDTGCAIYTNGTYSFSKALDFSKIKDAKERMNEMICSIYALFKEMKPAIVAIELTSVPRNPDTQRKLTMILGAIMGKCVDMNIPCYFYRPTEWRALVKDRGEKLPTKREELKQWAIKKCNSLGYEVTDDNEAEAILIGQAYINEWTQESEE